MLIPLHLPTNLNYAIKVVPYEGATLIFNVWLLFIVEAM
jgi:hypothetical protein